MGVAAYNRGSRALSRRIDEELAMKQKLKAEHIDVLYEAVQAAYKVAQIADTPEARAGLRKARTALWEAEDAASAAHLEQDYQARRKTSLW